MCAVLGVKGLNQGKTRTQEKHNIGQEEQQDKTIIYDET